MASSQKTPSGNPCLFASCFFFASMALSVKLCTQPDGCLGGSALPAIQVAFLRSALCLVWMFPLLLRDLKTFPVTKGMLKPLFMRSLAGGLAMIFYFQAIARLPLATAVLLNYTSPLWAALFAFIFLGEALASALYLAYPLALSGVLLVVGGPGASQDYVAVGLGLSSALMAGAAYTALRGLRGTPPSLVVTGLCLITTLLTAPGCLVNYVPPTSTGWGLLWVCSLSSAIAQVLMTLGYRTSTTAAASTVGLSTVAISGVLSSLFLGEMLNLQQWLGIALILWATSQTTRRSTLDRVVRSLSINWRRPAYRS